MVSWFGKSREKEEVKKEVAPIEKRRLYPVDRNPFYGTNFRTCAMRLDNGGDSYIKAFKKPDGSWKVLEVFETGANSPDGEPGINQQTTNDGIDFFAAVDALAQFETTKRFRYPEADPGQKAALGFEHYQAFGEREGIAFDKTGLPHETQDGEIITDGDFAKSALESFRKNYLSPQKQLQAIFTEATFNTDAAAAAFLPQLDSPPDLLKTVFDILKEGENQAKFLKDKMLKIKIFTESLAAVEEAWVDGLCQGFDKMEAARTRRRRTSLDMPETRKDFYTTTLERIKQTEINLNGLADVVEVSPMRQGLEVCKFSIALQYAGDLTQGAIQGSLDRPVSFYEKKTAELKSACLDSMRRLGIPDANEKYIDALILKEAQKPAPEWIQVDQEEWSQNRLAFIADPAGTEISRGWRDEGINVNRRASSIPAPIQEFFNKCARLPAQAEALVAEAEQNARDEALKAAGNIRPLLAAPASGI